MNEAINSAKMLAEGGYDPKEFRKSRENKMMVKLEEELKNRPSRDIVAEMVSSAHKIHGVATKSSNLKGTMIRILKESAVFLEVGADALAYRALPRKYDLAREMERLREEVKVLRDENLKLRIEKDSATTSSTLFS